MDFQPSHSFTNLNHRAQNNLIRYLQDLPSTAGPSEGGYAPYGSQDAQLTITRPRIVFMGDKLSGKTSIQSVVFNKLPPNETFQLQATTSFNWQTVHSFMDVQTLEFPGHFDYRDSVFDTKEMLREAGAVVYVIDSHAAIHPDHPACEEAGDVIVHVKAEHPRIPIIVFIHKIDNIAVTSEQEKYDQLKYRLGETIREAQQVMLDKLESELTEAKHSVEEIQKRLKQLSIGIGVNTSVVSFYNTSIYDPTIFLALSEVVQRLMPLLVVQTLEELLDNLVRNCCVAKAFLIDIVTMLYIAQDTQRDSTQYKICSEYIDTIVDLTGIYGWNDNLPAREPGNNGAECFVHINQLGSRDPQQFMYLYLKEVNNWLALVCIMKSDTMANVKPLIDHSVRILQRIVRQVMPRFEPAESAEPAEPVEPAEPADR